jgi:hypothetical protein
MMSSEADAERSRPMRVAMGRCSPADSSPPARQRRRRRSAQRPVAPVDGDRLTQMDVDVFFISSWRGGETTHNLITGGTLALFEHPEQRARPRPIRRCCRPRSRRCCGGSRR